jgi:hypothetical protein
MKSANKPTQLLNNKPVIDSNNEEKNAGSKSQFEKNIFSSADLWNIQRMSRTTATRRRTSLTIG